MPRRLYMSGKAAEVPTVMKRFAASLFRLGAFEQRPRDGFADFAPITDVAVGEPLQFDQIVQPHPSFNLATAKAVGLTIPTTLLARADEVIE